MIKFIFQTIILYLILLLFSRIFSFLELLYLNSLSANVINIGLLFFLILISLFVLFFQFLIVELKDLASMKLFISVFVLMILSNVVYFFYESIFYFNYFFIFILMILFLSIHFYERKFRNKYLVFGLNQIVVLLLVIIQFIVIIFFDQFTQVDLNTKINQDIESYHKNSLSSIESQSREFILNLYSNEINFFESEFCTNNQTCSVLLKERKNYFENNLEIDFSLSYDTLETFFYSSYISSTLILFILNLVFMFTVLLFGFKYLKYTTKPIIWIFDPFNVLRF